MSPRLTDRAAISVELVGAARHYGEVRALDATELTIEAGERVALIGPSGSGKSTLLRLIGGSLALSAGRVVVDGVSLDSLSQRQLRHHRARCGIIPQGSTLVPQLSVHHNVLTGLLPHWGWHRTAAAALFPYAFERQRVHKWLDDLGLAHMQDKLAADLSGGEQQRVAVARALLPNPSLILADEPTASLDPANARSVADLLLGPERAATVVLSTHWVSLVTGAVDRLIGLRHGQVVLDGTPAQIDEDALSALYDGSDERR